MGTEIKVTFNAEAVESPSDPSNFSAELAKVLEHGRRPTISLHSFDDSVRGVQLLRKVLMQYLVNDWNFSVIDDGDGGDIVIVNEDPTPVTQAIERKSATKPFIILSSARGDPRLMAIVNEYEHVGGDAHASLVAGLGISPTGTVHSVGFDDRLREIDGKNYT